MARGRDERRGSLAACGRHYDKERTEPQNTDMGPDSLTRATSREMGHSISVLPRASELVSWYLAATDRANA